MMKSLFGASLLVVLAACGEKAKPDTLAPSASVSAQRDTLLGGSKIDEAARAVESRPSASAINTNQPPPTGIFGPGEGDRVFARGSAPKLDVFDTGGEPKIKLNKGPFRPEQKLSLTLRLQLQEKDLLPPLAFNLVIAPGRPKAPAEAAKPGAKPLPTPSAGADAPAIEVLPNGDIPMVAHVRSVSVAGMASDQVPKQFADLIGTMEGGAIGFVMTKTGPTSFTRALGRKTDAETASLLDIEFGALEETLTGLYTPAPEQPVGENAYWMVTDRRPSLGTEVIRYRVFKVLQIEADQASLELTYRQYATEDKSALVSSSDMPDAVLSAYGANGKGVVEIAPGAFWPVGAALDLRVAANVMPAAGKNNPNLKGAPLKFNVEVAISPEPPTGAAAKAQEKPKK